MRKFSFAIMLMLPGLSIAASEQGPNQNANDATAGGIVFAVLDTPWIGGSSETEAITTAFESFLIDALRQSSEIRVVDVDPVQMPGGPTPTLALAMGASHFLETAIFEKEGRTQLLAQIIDGRSEEHLWSKRYNFIPDRPAEAIPALVADIHAELHPK